MATKECEDGIELVPAKVTYYVDAEMSTLNRFGPASKGKAEDLLLVLSARSDVKKATLVRVVEVIE